MKIQRTNDNDTNLRCQCSALAKLHDELTGNLNLATTERTKCACARMCVFIVFARTAFCIVKYQRVRACFIVSWLSGPALQTQNVCSDNGYININIFCVVLCAFSWTGIQKPIQSFQNEMRLHEHRRRKEGENEMQNMWNVRDQTHCSSNTV